MIQWDDYWKDYTVSKAEKWLICERDKIIKQYLDTMTYREKKVIEIGCGFGSNLRLLKTSRDDIECYALDSSQEAIRAIKKVITKAVVADCRRSYFGDREFDLIYSAGLMEHFQDEIPFLVEMKRILKEEGVFITFVPARYSLWQLYQILHFGFWQHGYEKAYTYSGLQRLFGENGFKVMEIRGIDPFSVGGLIMKLFNVSFEPPIRQSPHKSGYTELCVIAKKSVRK